MTDLIIVLIVSLFAWAGIFIYLLRLDLKIKGLEKNNER
jgi:CcmD family protein